MEEKKNSLQSILIIAILVAVLACVCVSLFTAKAVSDLRGEVRPESQETREDDVPIMDGEFRILPTTSISDAYHSGNTAGLSSKEKETLEMASEILNEIITEDMSDYEKEKAVYEWMTTELKYDTGVLQVIPATQADSDNPYGTLKNRNGVCVGYATTFRLFMQMLDIECMVVHNTGRYHSWDLVKLDGDWYHVDIYSDQDSTTYANFNMNDEFCAAQGHEWDREFFPAANGIEYNYVYQQREEIEDIYDIPAMLRAALDEEKGFLSLNFKVIDEPHAQIVETMLSGVENCMNMSEDYMGLWMHWSWMRVKGSEYLLAIYLNGYLTDEEDYDIPEEEQEKIDQAIEDAFGTLPDWGEVEAMGEEEWIDGECTGGPDDAALFANGRAVG